LRENIISWENELWHYISAGDGDNCPIYDHCDLRRRGYWCISDHRKYVEGMVYLVNNDLIDSHRGGVLRYLRPGRIFTLVEILAQRYLEMGEVSSPPVPDSLIEDIACQTDNIEVRLVPLTAYHGALWHIDDSWIIQLNKNDSHAVRRLTLFHEAFHILAHSCSTPVFRKISCSKGSFNELLAEYFTYQVLMPAEWVKNKWVEVQAPDIMAEIFNVPKSAMATVLRSLDLIDSTALRTAANESHNEAGYPYYEEVQLVDV
jgi:Zn-dependent peptidase ImmA (M78 family)